MCQSSAQISTDKSASVYPWREVAIAIAASARVTAERMRRLIADFDAGQKSACGKFHQIGWDAIAVIDRLLARSRHGSPRFFPLPGATAQKARWAKWRAQHSKQQEVEHLGAAANVPDVLL
jgi:hypothetical protein